MSLFLHHYHEFHGSFPSGTIADLRLPPEKRLSWMVSCLPYTDTGERLIPALDSTVAWDLPPNTPTGSAARHIGSVDLPPEHILQSQTCPDEPDAGLAPLKRPMTTVGMAGLGADAATLPPGHPRAGVFGYDRATKFADITDGMAQTIMLIETSRGLAPFLAGGPSSIRPIDPTTRPYIGPGRPFGGYHPGGVNVAFADGSIRFIRSSIDPKVFEAMSTISGGEPVPAGTP